ncbi:MAG: LytTR family DNA-binding domain-containing protein [Salinivirgaceae bacterium]|nr:LytTR family DNA-binding domain-containing protein [Salinivirgaceae bacterium]
MDLKQNNRLVFPIKDGYVVVKTHEILCAEGKSNYSLIHTLRNEEFVLTATLKQIADLLPSQTFFRIHKSHIINMNYINTINRKKAVVCLIDGSEFSIALRRLKKFLESISN